MLRFILLMVLLLSGCQNLPTQFALIGDNPYEENSFPKYERMIDDINERQLDWVIHVGDMKSGSSDCADSALRSIYQLNQRFEAPFILTPGDNDWFDCSRESAGGFDRRERLNKLREVFFSSGPELSVRRQSENGSEFVENTQWVQDGVVFGTVHLVGITGQEGGVDIHNEVMAAGVEWLREIFREAKQVGARGVFLATQADLYPLTAEPHLLGIYCRRCPLVRPFYEAFHQALLSELREFDRPVVLAVGDTHIFRVDKPLYDNNQLVEHFTRVETFGADQVHWVRVVVDPSTREVFSFHQEIIPGNSGAGWADGDSGKKEN